ncbi:hypothetical protein B7760_00587 [Burkholderia glumae]|nr:hypothetical protein B7760_00587 [Burkholderia glumae]
MPPVAARRQRPCPAAAVQAGLAGRAGPASRVHPRRKRDALPAKTTRRVRRPRPFLHAARGGRRVSVAPRRAAICERVKSAKRPSKKWTRYAPAFLAVARRADPLGRGGTHAPSRRAPRAPRSTATWRPPMRQPGRSSPRARQAATRHARHAAALCGAAAQGGHRMTKLIWIPNQSSPTPTRGHALAVAAARSRRQATVIRAAAALAPRPTRGTGPPVSPMPAFAARRPLPAHGAPARPFAASHGRLNAPPRRARRPRASAAARGAAA